MHHHKSRFGSSDPSETHNVPHKFYPQMRHTITPTWHLRPESPKNFYQHPDPDRTRTLRLEPDAHERLHSSPIRTLHKRDLDSGLVPPHLLNETDPDPGHKISSIDFFKPTPSPKANLPMNYAHELKVLTKRDPAHFEAYKEGKDEFDGLTRVVAHTFKGVSAPKRNPDVNPRGISRNVLGGFYTN